MLIRLFKRWSVEWAVMTLVNSMLLLLFSHKRQTKSFILVHILFEIYLPLIGCGSKIRYHFRLKC